MADSDLEAIRHARMQELQQSQQPQQPSSSGGGGENQKEDDQKSREAEARTHLLTQILEPAAADRLGRIRLVKASRAEDVENRLITLARSGQLRARVSEEQLKEILGAVSEQGGNGREGGEVRVQRRRGGWDDDDLEDLLEM